jgi:predicted Zn-dependent protease
MKARRFALVVLLAAAGGYGAYRVAGSVSRSAERAEALRLAGQRDYGTAIPLLKKALERVPDDAEVLRSLMESLVATNAGTEEIAPLLDRWCALQPSEPQPFVLRMRVRYRKNETDGAYEDAREILHIDPSNREARLLCARILRHYGRFEEARDECLVMLEGGALRDQNSRDWVGVMTVLAMIYVDQGENKKAAQILDALLARQPIAPDLPLFRAEVHLKLSEFTDAIPLLEMTSRSPNLDIRQNALSKLVVAYTGAERAEDARRASARLATFHEALNALAEIDARPKSWEARLAAARALLAADLPDRAAEVLDSAAAALGPHPSAPPLLAECHERLGSAPKATGPRGQADSGPNPSRPLPRSAP